MFSWLEKLKPGGSDSNSQHSATSERRDSDREEDGFLLVGETVSERTSVQGSQEYTVDQPPAYSQVKRKLYIMFQYFTVDQLPA